MTDPYKTPEQALNPDEMLPPRTAWRSFDATPWAHPWLTRENIAAMRAFSQEQIERSSRETVRGAVRRYAFVGNIANNTYNRARAITRRGFEPSVFGLHGDDFAFSDPRWEEFDGALPEGASLAAPEAFLAGIDTRSPFETLRISDSWSRMQVDDLPPFARRSDFLRYRKYFANLPGLERLQAFDALLAVQSVYMAYLANRPYAAATMGGDIWLEASRGDSVGQLQRLAYRKAGATLVSNPWIYAKCRRLGIKNAVYLPYCIDENRYAPGAPSFREEWEARTGGRFFALTTSRMNSNEKGSEIGISGFIAFVRQCPAARLIVLDWGDEAAETRAALAREGVTDKALFLPPVGKKRLVAYLNSADCLIDQFRIGNYGASALEAAGCGLPVVMRFEAEQYAAMAEGGAPPFLNAATPDAVCAALLQLEGAPALREALRTRHREWLVASHGGARWSEAYENMLGFIASGASFDFTQSPIARPLSEEENAYHAAQLRAAPSYPSYFGPPAAQRDAGESWGIKRRHLDWLEEFRRKNGRNPKVLSLSNIANNGYRDGAVLRARGVEVDLVVNDYYHVMGCPEWEECAVDGALIDEMKPDWGALPLGGYERPRWIAQGRLDRCLDY
ncbi:MAG: glycosyltransferase, partial [Parvularculaceae bacterium]|nr:glycosyltransferase [Parvularculaceae bacterium]